MIILLFSRIAELVLSSSVVTFLHALVTPKWFSSFVIWIFEGRYIFRIYFSNVLGVLLKKMENKRQIFKEHQLKIRTQKKWNWTKP